VGKLIEGTIANCYVEGGGLVGDNYGTITNSYSTGSVSRGGSGLVGRNYGTITNCYSTRSVSGGGSGLVGSNYGTITNCYSTGSVTGDRHVGGLVGYNGGGISECYSTGNVTGNSGVGGLVGGNSEAGISECYSTGSVSGGDYVGGLVGYNQQGTVSDSYATGSISGDLYVGGLVGDNYEGIITNCHAIAEVSGDYSVGGLVGDTYWGTITDCSATASVTGNAQVGGLVGGTHRTQISNCYASVDVSGRQCVGGVLGRVNLAGGISNCYSEGIVSGIEDVGGLVGAGGGSIRNSYSTAGVSGTTNVGGLAGARTRITNSYSTGAVNGVSYVGGLVGFCVDDITNCYSTGSVEGEGYVGGLAGYNDGGDITDSFWDIETSGQTTSSYGGTGLPTADMQMQISFTDAGWDFLGETVNGSEDIWRLCVDGASYPELNWQFLPGDFLCPDRVDFIDYSFFASHWLEDNCRASNDCNGTDLDRLGTVEINDLAIFVGNWLAGRPPGQASNPNPTDGATGVDMDADLNWTLGDWAALHEVYFGSDPCALPLVATQPAGQNSYDPPGDLILGATYYWRIDVVGTYGTIRGTVWSFTTIRGQAHTPSPADGVVIPGYEYEHPPGSGNWYVCAELVFGEGPTAVNHTGYFSEDYNDVAGRVQDANLGPPPYGSIPGRETTYYVGDPVVAPANDSLVRGMTYYWCVDESDGDTTYSGEIWSFRVMPVEVWGPDPADGATDVPADPNLTVSWNLGAAEDPGYEITYDIYYGTDQSEVETSTTLIANVETTSHTLTGLEPETTYYWRIDTKKTLTAPPFTVDIIPGNLWSFTTASGKGI
jgi:hypothetical protein